jgi:uncharacterized protein (DUF2147 family)
MADLLCCVPSLAESEEGECRICVWHSDNVERVGGWRREPESESMYRAMLGLVLTLTVGLADASPIGLWKSIDEQTEEATAVVRIAERDGVLVGEIVEILDAKAKPDAVCVPCTDDRRDAPILGLAIIRDVKPNARPEGPWDGGEILDPNNGKVYKLRLSLAERGERLLVRGYIGRPMFGRTQVWHRVE